MPYQRHEMDEIKAAIRQRHPGSVGDLLATTFGQINGQDHRMGTHLFGTEERPLPPIGTYPVDWENAVITGENLVSLYNTFKQNNNLYASQEFLRTHMDMMERVVLWLRYYVLPSTRDLDLAVEARRWLRDALLHVGFFYVNTYYGRNIIYDAGDVPPFTPTPPPALPGVITITSPSDGATGLARAVGIAYNKDSVASRYRIHISKVSNFASFVMNLASVELTRQFTGEYATTYFLRVRGENDAGNGPWSSVVDFTIMADPNPPPPPPPLPGKPTITKPVQSATDVVIPTEISWTAAADAVDYILEISHLSDFSIIELYAVTQGLSYTIVSLERGVTYHARVTAKNSTGNGVPSDTVTFSTFQEITEPPPVTPPEPPEPGIPGLPSFASNPPGFNPKKIIRSDDLDLVDGEPYKYFEATICHGPEIIGDPQDGTVTAMFGYIYLLEYRETDDTLYLWKKVNNTGTGSVDWEHVTTDLPALIPGFARYSPAFDGSARLIYAYEDRNEGEIIVTRWNPNTLQYVQDVNFEGKNPAMMNDAVVMRTVDDSDVYLFYQKEGEEESVYSRIERDTYAVERLDRTYTEKRILERAYEGYLRYALVWSFSPSGLPPEFDNGLWGDVSPLYPLRQELAVEFGMTTKQIEAVLRLISFMVSTGTLGFGMTTKAIDYVSTTKIIHQYLQMQFGMTTKEIEYRSIVKLVHNYLAMNFGMTTKAVDYPDIGIPINIYANMNFGMTTKGIAYV